MVSKPLHLMFKLNFSLLFILLWNLSLNAQSLTWATQFKGIDQKRVTGGATDDAGNIYTVGCFQGVVDFDPSPNVFNLDAGGELQNDIFVMKQSPDGNLEWVYQFGSDRFCTGTDIAVSPAGDVCITGLFGGTTLIDFDPGPGVTTFTPMDFNDVFVLRLNSAGGFVWAKHIGGPTDFLDTPHLAIDPMGNVLLNVNYYGTLDFDPGPAVFNLITPPNSITRPDMAVCKLSAAGNFVWAKLIAGPSTDRAHSINADNNGNVLIGGYIFEVVDMDPGPGVFNLTAGGTNRGFVTKLNPDGNFIWAYLVSEASSVTDISSDTHGNHYVISLANFGQYPLYFSRILPGGNIQWTKTLVAESIVPTSYGWDIQVDSKDNIIIALKLNGKIDFDTGPGILHLSGGARDIGLAQYTPGGDLVWARKIGNGVSNAGSSGASIPSESFMFVDKADNIIIGGDFSSTLDFDPGPGTMNLTSVGVGWTGDMYVAKYSRANLITGNTFKDANGDGIRQSTEPYLSNVIIKGTRDALNYYAISDSNGLFQMIVDTGSYSIAPSLPLYYTSIIPSTHNAAFGSSYGLIDSVNHFALLPAIIKDLRVKITNFGPARPGFPTIYRITYTNMGTDTLSGDIVMDHDARFSFVESSPVPANYTNPVLKWNFVNLPPSASRNIDVRFGLGFTVALGTILKSYCTANPITGDFNPANNIDSLHHVVTGSFDPNDKKVNPDGAISPAFVSSGNYLEYTIRFQNTGTDTAFTVTVKDTLSANVDISSFETLAVSHNYAVNLKGNGIAEWRFSNILLPDSTTNEPKSHGFIRYRVKPKNTLIVGEQVKNKAAIYFDYNAPVITNETINTITVITSINPVVSGIESKVFPNPTRSVLYLQTKGYFYYSVYDATGKIIVSPIREYNEAIINADKLARGIYFVEIKTSKGKAVHKIWVN